MSDTWLGVGNPAYICALSRVICAWETVWGCFLGGLLKPAQGGWTGLALRPDKSSVPVPMSPVVMLRRGKQRAER